MIHKKLLNISTGIIIGGVLGASAGYVITYNMYGVSPGGGGGWLGNQPLHIQAAIVVGIIFAFLGSFCEFQIWNSMREIPVISIVGTVEAKCVDKDLSVVIPFSVSGNAQHPMWVEIARDDSFDRSSILICCQLSREQRLESSVTVIAKGHGAIRDGYVRLRIMDMGNPNTTTATAPFHCTE